MPNWVVRRIIITTAVVSGFAALIGGFAIYQGITTLVGDGSDRTGVAVLVIGVVGLLAGFSYIISFSRWQNRQRQPSWERWFMIGVGAIGWAVVASMWFFPPLIGAY